MFIVEWSFIPRNLPVGRRFPSDFLRDFAPIEVIEILEDGLNQMAVLRRFYSVNALDKKRHHLPLTDYQRFVCLKEAGSIASPFTEELDIPIRRLQVLPRRRFCFPESL